MHCSIINSLFTMPFYKNESGIIFFNFICLLVFLVKLSIIHCFIILRMMEIKGFLMIIKHILMLFNHEFFNMIMYQYVILPDVLLNYRLLLKYLVIVNMVLQITKFLASYNIIIFK